MNRKQPLETKHVKAIIAKFKDGNLGQLQIATLITLGFSAFLRWDDLSNWKGKTSLEEDHMKIFLVKCKNDQY